MKTTLLRSLSLLGASLLMGLTVAAQEQPKVKVNDNESKYKSDDVKVKVNDEEAKYKSRDVKIKENEDETKVKVKGVKPVRPTTTQRTTMKEGETQVRTNEHVLPLNTESAAPSASEPVVAGKVAVPKSAATVKKEGPRKYAGKSTARKPVAARKAGAAPKYIVRTKVVRDTVFVPSPPERVVSTQTEYVRDTVMITRVDTVVKVETKNTYNGYRVPAGDFKKVKLKKDKNGEVIMKRKE